ncbi:hypothetical protein PsorP6_004582 [Peronosclerospora sorghi]|uniref:Uncharacterized protein n=1 Tax=Peronosclerospora sorghi TaxID=230839 RepID=A0ACC0VKW9_9STRA|nr:hypothetical protein PsorP6_004582 [Peronosclerospora sorghi]
MATFRSWLLKLWEIEFRLFLKLCGHDASDDLFVFLSENFCSLDEAEESREGNEDVPKRSDFY